ncbi:MAG TPA: condensation domain-containing protein, partial [Pyrinomonadaceae bacterium]|nr:condensation domain-containing protein [Pyrinomonadaceae bacterium]
MTQRINTSQLSAEQQHLLEQLLREEGIDVAGSDQIPRRRSDDEIPLSFAQQRLWFLDQLNTESSAYNMGRALRLTGDLNQAAMEQALTELLRRHESLRTTFAAHDGQARQVIAPPARFQLPVTDLSTQPAAEREATIQQLLQTEAERPFDLARGPLFRAALLRLGEREHVFFMNMHHIVSDGWSMMLFFK